LLDNVTFIVRSLDEQTKICLQVVMSYVFMTSYDTLLSIISLSQNIAFCNTIRKNTKNIFFLPMIIMAARRSSISVSGFCNARMSVRSLSSNLDNVLFVSLIMAAALNTARLWASSYCGINYSEEIDLDKLYMGTRCSSIHPVSSNWIATEILKPNSLIFLSMSPQKRYEERKRTCSDNK